MTFSTWRWWGCQPHAPAAFTPRKSSWYSFSLGVESTPGPWYGRKEYVTEKSSDTTGNRSRDRPVNTIILNYISYNKLSLSLFTFYSTMWIKNQKIDLIPPLYFYWNIFIYVFRPVIRLSSGWHFCYKNTVWSNMPNYSTLLKFVWLLVRIFSRMIV